jgi:hypothetical protein
MKKTLNPNTTLLAVGVLQPTSAAEVRGFLNTLFPKSGALPSTQEVEHFLLQQNEMGRLVRLNANGLPFYSLSLHGSYFLTADLRKTRDKFRAYLLRDAHRVRFIESREVAGGDLAGALPASDTSSRVKGRAANKLGRTAFGRRFAYGRPYWPRIPRQFANKTGQARSSRDTFPSFLSFESKEQWANASNKDVVWDYVGLGLCLGLSPQLIWNISHQQDRHYRSFEIAKRGGGLRIIESPRVFLKVIQWFLADFVLDDLQCHDSVHSFRSDRSIATNAAVHVSERFVGNVDIENFFGNITTENIRSYLLAQGFNQVEARIISNLSSNSVAAPPRAYRRKVRAMFHQAKTNPIDNVTKIPQLGGAIGYLKIFPKLQNSREVKEYEAVLWLLKEVTRAQLAGP